MSPKPPHQAAFVFSDPSVPRSIAWMMRPQTQEAPMGEYDFDVVSDVPDNLRRRPQAGPAQPKPDEKSDHAKDAASVPRGDVA
jgi:hypothetical protein